MRFLLISRNLVLKWVGHKYRVVALGAGREQRHRAADQLFDPTITGALRQVVAGDHMRQKLLADRKCILVVDPDPEETALLHAARATGKPVHWVSGRAEAFVTDTQGRDSFWSVS